MTRTEKRVSVSEIGISAALGIAGLLWLAYLSRIHASPAFNVSLLLGSGAGWLVAASIMAANSAPRIAARLLILIASLTGIPVLYYLGTDAERARAIGYGSAWLSSLMFARCIRILS